MLANGVVCGVNLWDFNQWHCVQSKFAGSLQIVVV